MNIDFEIKKITMMLQKVKTQQTMCRASVLSASIERSGFWFNECSLNAKVIEQALELQLFELKKVKRSSQQIEKA